MEKRRMCPSCRAFVSTTDKVCPYCDTPLGARAIERRSSADVGLIPGARFTTVVILLINAGLYAATTVYSINSTGSQGALDIDGRTLLIFGAKARDLILAGQWWRLITAGFLHGGVLHIVMNSWVIFDLGATAEEFYGTSRYLVIYFLTNLGGFIASAWWSASLSVGASAPLFGLIGAMIAVGVKNRSSSMGAAMRSHYTQWALWGLAMGLLPGFRVDNAAHIGGLLTGFALGYVAGTPRVYSNWIEKAWQIAAVASVIITLAAFANMILFLTSV
ncbi:MAG: rhomboid family intramembrane serine protease [Bryobacteraceae bacterium]|nr:rhomboid family intramembrane serine protease [Bryobacteraceae bacterium]